MRLYYSLQRYNPILGKVQALNWIIGWHRSRGKPFLMPREEFKALAPTAHIHCPTRCSRVGLPQAFSIHWLWGRRLVWCPATAPKPVTWTGPQIPLLLLHQNFSEFSISSPKWPWEGTEQLNPRAPEGTRSTLSAAPGLRQHPVAGTLM